MQPANASAASLNGKVPVVVELDFWVSPLRAHPEAMESSLSKTPITLYFKLSSLMV